MTGIGQITHVVIHYSATFPDWDVTVADIDRMHRARTPPFRCVGYHFFIRRDGTVEPGRAETVLGAHVAGQNTGKLGICWAGGIERTGGPGIGVDNMTAAQEASLIRVIRELLRRYPGAEVVGHRDLAATQCPGFDVIPWWTKIERPQAVPSSLVATEASNSMTWLAAVRRALLSAFAR